MTGRELRDILNAMSEADLDKTISIDTLCPNAIGPKLQNTIKTVGLGIDWNIGTLFLYPEDEVVRIKSLSNEKNANYCIKLAKKLSNANHLIK